MKTIKNLLLIVLLAAGTSVMAQQGGMRGNAPMNQGNRARAGMENNQETPALQRQMGGNKQNNEAKAFQQTDRLVKELSLSDEQAMKILTINRKYVAQDSVKRASLLGEKTGADRDAMTKKMESVKKEMATSKTAKDKEIKAVLKAYQKEKYDFLQSNAQLQRENGFMSMNANRLNSPSGRGQMMGGTSMQNHRQFMERGQMQRKGQMMANNQTRGGQQMQGRGQQMEKGQMTGRGQQKMAAPIENKAGVGKPKQGPESAPSTETTTEP